MRSALLTLTAACAVFALPAHAQEAGDATEASQPTADEQLEALTSEIQALEAAFWKKVHASETDEERERVQATRPKRDDFAPRFLEIARTHPGSDAAVEALAWVLDNCQSPEPKTTALELIVSDNLESEELAGICSTLSREVTTAAHSAVQKILIGSPHRRVQGYACYSLAKQHTRLAKIADKVTASKPDESYVSWYTNKLGEARMAEIGKTGAAHYTKEAETLFERLAAEFGDVKSRRSTFGQVAASNLFEIRHLQIGMPAPDIEGDDLNGVSFKLSDYRGKVVVLDFWGNW